MAYLKNERGRQMQHKELYRLLGLDPKKHLPAFGLPTQMIGNVEVYVRPAPTDGNHRRSGKPQRVIAICPVCLKHVAFGNFEQHLQVHPLTDSDCSRRTRTAEEKDRIVAEAAATSVYGTARRYGISENQLRRWREYAAKGTLADDPAWMATDRRPRPAKGISPAQVKPSENETRVEGTLAVKFIPGRVTRLGCYDPGVIIDFQVKDGGTLQIFMAMRSDAREVFDYLSKIIQVEKGWCKPLLLKP